jgi:Tfp pilus assembly protein PilN
MRAVNLIPSDARRGASVGAGRSQGVAYVVLGVLGAIAVLVLLYGVARHHESSRRAQLASISAETRHAREAVAALTPYTSFQALREQRTAAVTSVVNSRFDWAHAFHELGRVLPHDAAIASLDGTVGSASATGSSSSTTTSAAGSSTPAGSVPTITLGGCASSQSEVALTLQRLRLIDGVSAVSLKNSTKAGSGGNSSSSSSAKLCTPSSPSFSVQVTFDPLPAAGSQSTGTASTQLTAATGGGQ